MISQFFAYITKVFSLDADSLFVVPFHINTLSFSISIFFQKATELFALIFTPVNPKI
jgi:hypothetical protein